MRINQIVWQHGGMAALISIILSLVAYIMGVEMLVGWQLGAAQSLLIIITMVVVSRAIRSDEDGFINFGRLLGHIMISVVCLLLASIIFNLVLFNIIDPDLINIVTEINMERVEDMMVSFGIDGDILKETLIEAEKEVRNGYKVGGAIKGLVYGSAVWGLIALIIAAIYKRSPENTINF